MTTNKKTSLAVVAVVCLLFGFSLAVVTAYEDAMNKPAPAIEAETPLPQQEESKPAPEPKPEPEPEPEPTPVRWDPRVILGYSIPEEVWVEVQASAIRHNIDPALILAVGHVESTWRLDVRGRAGEYGPLQVMPSTAISMGVSNLNDWRETLDAGVKYLAKMLQRAGGDLDLALAFYNAGPSRGPDKARRYAGQYPSKVGSVYERHSIGH